MWEAIWYVSLSFGFQWGATYAAIISSVFILVGAIISSSVSTVLFGSIAQLISVQGANVNHVGLLIGGRVLLGFGSTGKLTVFHSD